MCGCERVANSLRQHFDFAQWPAQLPNQQKAKGTFWISHSCNSLGNSKSQPIRLASLTWQVNLTKSAGQHDRIIALAYAWNYYSLIKKNKIYMKKTLIGRICGKSHTYIERGIADTFWKHILMQRIKWTWKKNCLPCKIVEKWCPCNIVYGP